MVVLHVLLVRDRHVGTLLLAAASLLGAVWAGIAVAGVMVRGGRGDGERWQHRAVRFVHCS